MPLYLISTPIGNLADFSYRATQILAQCDYLLCEDTRHSKILLDHYQISKPLKSLHQFNETAKINAIIADLQEGLSIALMSDAGTPLIQDPGYPLVQRCIQENLPIDALPGPCALITALTLSGLKTDCFQFLGFLPRKEQALLQTIEVMAAYPGTSIGYESIHRVQDTLKAIADFNPHLKIAVARELTKKFQDIYRGSAQQAFEYYQTAPLKGEIVLLVEGMQRQEELDLPHLVFKAEKQWDLSRSDAIKQVAKQYGLPKKQVYQAVLDAKSDAENTSS